MASWLQILQLQLMRRLRQLLQQRMLQLLRRVELLNACRRRRRHRRRRRRLVLQLLIRRLPQLGLHRRRIVNLLRRRCRLLPLLGLHLLLFGSLVHRLCGSSQGRSQPLRGALAPRPAAVLLYGYVVATIGCFAACLVPAAKTCCRDLVFECPNQSRPSTEFLYGQLEWAMPYPANRICIEETEVLLFRRWAVPSPVVLKYVDLQRSRRTRQVTYE